LAPGIGDPPTGGEGGGIGGSNGSLGPGTMLSDPHSGHWACRPTVSSAVRNSLLHFVQRNSIGMEFFLIL
jgi:hypothetical protein